MPNDIPRPATQEYSLEGMGELLQKLQPGIDLEAGPQSEEQQRTAAAEKAAQETLEGKPEEKAEEAEAEKIEAESEKELAEGEKKEEGTEKEDVEKTEEKPEEEENPEAKAEEKKASDDPDNDLESKVKEAMEPHTRPKTRQLAEFLKGEAKTARAAQRALAAEKQALEAKVAELQAAGGKAELPKDVAEELKTLRERVQELDATKDPAIVQKFDVPISRNTETIIKTLKEFGIEKNEDGTANPEALRQLQREGFTLKSLKPYLDDLEKNGFPDEAEAIREAVRENMRLSRDKGYEVDAIKGQIGQRVAARTQESERVSQQRDQQVYAKAGDILQKDVSDLSKTFTELVKPPEPSPNDAPAVAQAKRAALAEFQRVDSAIGEVVKSFRPAGNEPAQEVEARGRMVAHAIQGVILKQRLVPALKATVDSQAKTIADLQGRLAKFKKAGSLTQAHSASVGDGKAAPEKKEDAPGTSLEDSFRNFAKGQGVAV